MSHDRKSIFSIALLAMVVTHTLIHAAGSMNSTLIVELRDEFTLSNIEIGMITAIPSLITVALTLPAGWMSDRYGARRLVALSIALAAVGALIAGFTINPAMYIVGLVLMNLTSTVYHPPAFSYTARIVETRDRSKAMGWLNAGGTFGYAIGPLSITVLMGYLAFQWRHVFLFWVPFVAGAFLLVHFMRDMKGAGTEVEREEETSSEQTSLINRDFLIFLTSSGVRDFAASMIGTFLSIYLFEARGWTVAHLGIMYGASSVLGLVASPIGGYAAARLGDKNWAVMSITAGAFAYIAAFYTEGVVTFMFLYLLHRFCGILSMGATSALTSKLTPRRQMGMGFAISFLPRSLTTVVAPLAAALIAEYFGLFPIFTIGFLITLIGVGVLHFGVKTS
jgi:MFS family permease